VSPPAVASGEALPTDHAELRDWQALLCGPFRSESCGAAVYHLPQQVSALRRASLVDSRHFGGTVVCTLRDPHTAELQTIALRLLIYQLRHGQALLDALDSGDEALTTSSAVHK
jgi:hypothetical protein